MHGETINVNGIKVFGKNTLDRMVTPKRQEVTGTWNNKRRISLSLLHPILLLSLKQRDRSGQDTLTRFGRRGTCTVF